MHTNSNSCQSGVVLRADCKMHKSALKLKFLSRLKWLSQRDCHRGYYRAIVGLVRKVVCRWVDWIEFVVILSHLWSDFLAGLFVFTMSSQSRCPSDWPDLTFLLHSSGHVASVCPLVCTQPSRTWHEINFWCYTNIVDDVFFIFVVFF